MTVTDLFFFIGFALLIAGLAWVSIPVALIVAGLIAMVTGVAISDDTQVIKKKKKKK